MFLVTDLVSLSYHLSLRPLFCLFLIGRLKQIFVYCFFITVLLLEHVGDPDLTSVTVFI